MFALQLRPCVKSVRKDAENKAEQQTEAQELEGSRHVPARLQPTDDVENTQPGAGLQHAGAEIRGLHRDHDGALSPRDSEHDARRAPGAGPESPSRDAQELPRTPEERHQERIHLGRGCLRAQGLDPPGDAQEHQEEELLDAGQKVQVGEHAAEQPEGQEGLDEDARVEEDHERVRDHSEDQAELGDKRAEKT